MSTRFKCRQGHEWEVQEAPVAVDLCPQCGAVAANTASWDGQPDATPSPHNDRTLVNAATSLHEFEPASFGYEIISQIGQGGMGVVYKARQTDLNRIVALKMLMGGEHAPPDVLTRFRTEAEAIASLNHPHIVQIYEVGQRHNQPYLALEFVGGGSLADQIRGRPQPPRQAAQLVETIARAVHAAHQRGIIHRDLKPGNVLLELDGTPKVTDFGLARRLNETERLTPTGDVLGTPSYMAPEQASGAVRNVGPAADVYALGAILYEMLVGRPPFLAENPVETVLQVLRDEPVPPRRLLPNVPRDLETICLKCLQKLPRKRYPSAEDLAKDLHCFVTGEPIAARPISSVERLWKWARRKPAIAMLAAVSFLAAVVVVCVSLWYNVQLQSAAKSERASRQHAELNFQKARQAVKELTELAREELANVPHADPIKKVLLERASRFHRDFVEQAGNDAGVRLEAGQAAYDLGDIHEMLNDLAAARTHYEQAVRIFSDLAKAHPKAGEFQRELAHSLIQLGSFLAANNASNEAEPHLRQALEILQNADLATDPATRLERARACTNLGPILHEINRGDEAERILHEGENLLIELVTAYPREPSYQEKLAAVRVNLGVVLNKRGQHNAAAQIWLQALEGYKILADANPAKRSYRRNLAVTCYKLGNRVAEAGPDRLRQAETYYQLALDYQNALTRDFPQVPQFRHDQANTLEVWGLALYVAGQRERGEKLCHDALSIKRKLMEEFPKVPEYRESVGLSLTNTARQAAKRAAWSEAGRDFDEAIRYQAEAVQLDPNIVRYRRQLADTRWFVAEMLIGLKDHAGAAKSAAQVAASFPESGEYAHYAARLFARCIPLVEKDDKLSPTERQAVIQSYTDQTIATLRVAIQKGFKDFAGEAAMKDFEPLRESTEFLRLIAPSKASPVPP